MTANVRHESNERNESPSLNFSFVYVRTPGEIERTQFVSCRTVFGRECTAHTLTQAHNFNAPKSRDDVLHEGFHVLCGSRPAAHSEQSFASVRCEFDGADDGGSFFFFPCPCLVPYAVL